MMAIDASKYKLSRDSFFESTYSDYALHWSPAGKLTLATIPEDSMPSFCIGLLCQIPGFRLEYNRYILEHENDGDSAIIFRSLDIIAIRTAVTKMYDNNSWKTVTTKGYINSRNYLPGNLQQKMVTVGLLILLARKDYGSENHYEEYYKKRAQAIISTIKATNISYPQFTREQMKSWSQFLKNCPKFSTMMYKFLIGYKTIEYPNSESWVVLIEHVINLMKYTEMRTFFLIRTFVSSTRKTAAHYLEPVMNEMKTYDSSYETFIASYKEDESKAAYHKLLKPESVDTSLNNFPYLSFAAVEWAKTKHDSFKNYTIRKPAGWEKIVEAIQTVFEEQSTTYAKPELTSDQMGKMNLDEITIAKHLAILNRTPAPLATPETATMLKSLLTMFETAKALEPPSKQ